MKGPVSDSPARTVFNWAEGHLSEKKGLRSCSHLEIMNDLVDRLVDVALRRAMQSQAFIERFFSSGKLRV